jgi:hypothetical protein
MVLAWFPAVALACGASPDAADDDGIDASTPLMQTFTVQQPAAPALQQLINSCASGVQTSCVAMCRSMFCEFGEPGGTLRILACTLHRSGPFANITVTFDGRPECISPGIPPSGSTGPAFAPRVPST